MEGYIEDLNDPKVEMLRILLAFSPSVREIITRSTEGPGMPFYFGHSETLGRGVWYAEGFRTFLSSVAHFCVDQDGDFRNAAFLPANVAVLVKIIADWGGKKRLVTLSYDPVGPSWFVQAGDHIEGAPNATHACLKLIQHLCEEDTP